ncbi:MAG: PAS domain S-box protein [Candidatus Hydrogenedentes bacterium]|nr:PAS domain S-box protein [Candidatus Hydrogenedentota bacterium]
MTAERGSNEDKQRPRVKCKKDAVRKDTRSKALLPETDRVSDAVLYRAILDGAYDWEFFVRPDGVYLYVSPSCERISGYTSEDFLSDPALMDRIVHPDDRERWVEHEESLHTCETPMEIDFRILRRDGQVVWIGHVCHRVFDGTEVFIGRRGSNRDITAHKRAEEALRESEERYRLIFDGSKEGIIFIGADNRRDILNNRLAEMCGYTVEELVGTSALTMIHPDDFERVRENNRKRLAGELPSSTYEFRVIHKDGHSIDVEGTFNSINRDGKVIGVCGILRDIGARKRIEESLREREELYRQMFDSHAILRTLTRFPQEKSRTPWGRRSTA